jgi:hypothetical protein
LCQRRCGATLWAIASSRRRGRDRDRILSAGLIDIKTHYSETPEDIIERVRLRATG